ncbi:MAG TPA: hypothetical protein VLI67_08530, partial [Vicinamibacteria bacterium]|nr:hypothetical protein [Vicinamibacteria bacterium]
EKLSAYLVAVEEKTGLSPLVALIRAEHLKGALEGAELLAVMVDAAGGGNKATRNIWTGSKLYHTGGVAVTVLVFDAEGTIAFSKAYRCAAAYTRFEREPDRFIGNLR